MPQTYTDQTKNYGILWNRTTDAGIVSVSTIREKGKDAEILVALTNGSLLLLNSSGQIVKQYRIGEKITADPLIADINGDNIPEIITPADNGTIYALDLEGRILWNYTAGGVVTGTPVLLNATSDPNDVRIAEIFFGSWDKNLYALSARGILLWSYRASAPIEYSPAVGDADSDGKTEVVFASEDGSLYGKRQEKTWTYKLSSEPAAAPVVKDIDMDGKKETVVAAKDGRVEALEYYINSSYANTQCDARSCTSQEVATAIIAPIWSYKIDGVIESMTTADINADGMTETLVSASNQGPYAQDEALYVLDCYGELIKEYSTDGKIFSPPVIASIFPDNQTKIIFGTAKGTIYMLDPWIKAGWIYKIGEPLRNSIKAHDLDMDGTSELLVPGEKTVYVFGLAGVTDNHTIKAVLRETITANIARDDANPGVNGTVQHGNGTKEDITEDDLNNGLDAGNQTEMNSSGNNESIDETASQEPADTDAAPETFVETPPATDDFAGINQTDAPVQTGTEQSRIPLIAFSAMLLGLLALARNVGKRTEPGFSEEPVLKDLNGLVKMLHRRKRKLKQQKRGYSLQRFR